MILKTSLTDPEHWCSNSNCNKLAELHFTITFFFLIFNLYEGCVWSNYRSIFATLIETSPKLAFWTHQPLLLVSKNVDLSFYFLRTGNKRRQVLSRCVSVVWADVCVRACIVSWWRVIRLRRLADCNTRVAKSRNIKGATRNIYLMIFNTTN